MTSKHLFFFSFLFLFSCKDKSEKPNSLPPITSEGKGTFGCKVNGQIFVPAGSKGKLEVEYYTWNLSPEFYGTFVITADRSGENGLLEFCQISHPRIFSKGTYYISHKTTTQDTSGFASVKFKNTSFSLSSGKGIGKININRYDTFARIISGTFDFWTCNDKDIKDTAFVTEGRFDVKY